MPAPKGNKYWLARSSHGRKPIFGSPQELEKACNEYFQWVEANPLQEEKVFQYQGEIVRTNINKIRAMTISGLCLFLDINDDTWKEYKKKDKDFSAICESVEKTIYNQKFAGASADLLNHAIIARELGLIDKQELKIDPESRITTNMTLDDATAAYLDSLK